MTPALVFGTIPTSQQWNNFFGGKLDDLPVQYAAPGTGVTLSSSLGQGAWILDPSGEVAVLTIDLPIGTFEGQRFTVTTTQTIDSLTVVASGIQIVTGGAVGVLSADGGVEWRFRLETATWYRWR